MRVRISRGGDGLRLDLSDGEAALLQMLLDELDALLDPDSAPAVADGLGAAQAEQVLDRLFPAAYRDVPAAAAAFRDMTAAALRTDRVERIETCLAELAAARGRRHARLELDGDGVQRWLRVLNDLRLTLGTLLGVSEDDDWDPHDGDPADPLTAARVRYVWLTAVQDTLVQAVMGGR